jgi:hypothetical protein
MCIRTHVRTYVCMYVLTYVEMYIGEVSHAGAIKGQTSVVLEHGSQWAGGSVGRARTNVRWLNTAVFLTQA